MGDEFEFESLQRSNGIEGIVWPYLGAPRETAPTHRPPEMLPSDIDDGAREALPGPAVDGQQLAVSGLRRRGRQRHANQQIASIDL